MKLEYEKLNRVENHCIAVHTYRITPRLFIKGDALAGTSPPFLLLDSALLTNSVSKSVSELDGSAACSFLFFLMGPFFDEELVVGADDDEEPDGFLTSEGFFVFLATSFIERASGTRRRNKRSGAREERCMVASR